MSLWHSITLEVNQLSILEKLKNGFSKKAETQHTSSLEVYRTKLMDIVYDEEVANELAPIMAKLAQHEGFDKVWELLEAKEAQVEQVAGGEWNKSVFEDENEDVIEPNKQQQSKTEKVKTAEEILAEQFKQ